MTIGEGTGILGLIRSWLTDRPNVKIIARLRDYGPLQANVVTTLHDLMVVVEVHSTGAQPVHVVDVGMEFGDHREQLGRVNDTLTRPEFHFVHCHVSYLRKRTGTRRLTAIYVSATPERVFRIKPPKGWERFPTELPRIEAGR